MLVYSQSTGQLKTWAGKLLGAGYAGNGAGKNNPLAQTQRAVGPIPRGFWRIGAPYASANTGPYTIPIYKLDEAPGDDVDGITGRSAFRIHGDSASRPGEASQGCIILARAIREAIVMDGSEILMVLE